LQGVSVSSAITLSVRADTGMPIGFRSSVLLPRNIFGYRGRRFFRDLFLFPSGWITCLLCFRPHFFLLEPGDFTATLTASRSLWNFGFLRLTAVPPPPLAWFSSPESGSGPLLRLIPPSTRPLSLIFYLEGNLRFFPSCSYLFRFWIVLSCHWGTAPLLTLCSSASLEDPCSVGVLWRLTSE